MSFLSAFVTFENLHEVRRLCHWGPIIALSVIAICSTMAILDSIIWYWPVDTTGGSINFIMLINWTVLILYNYFNAMFVGPGYIPLGWKPVRIGSVLACCDIDALLLKVYHLFLFIINCYCLWHKTGESAGYPVPAVLQSMPRLQGTKISSLSQVQQVTLFVTTSVIILNYLTFIY